MGVKFIQKIIDTIRGKDKTIVDLIRYGNNTKIYSQELKSTINKYNQNKRANILVEKEKIDNGKCAVYFSSNGLYYPMNLVNFNKKIKAKNFFEFYKTRYTLASSHIFLRDLRYLWYQFGINEKYNTVEKVADLLRNLAYGKEIYTFGGSSGGFAAILFGILINAKFVVVSDPQIDFQLMLKTQYDKNEYAEHYENQIFKDILNKKLKYSNLQSLIETTDTKLYVISSQNSWVDLPQIELIKGCKNIKFLFNKSEEHGAFGGKVFSDIMSLSESELDLLFSNKLYLSQEEVKNTIVQNKDILQLKLDKNIVTTERKNIVK